ADSTVHGIYEIDVSPDGSQVVYCAATAWGGYGAEMRIVSALGGPSRVVASNGRNPSWNPNGKEVGYITYFPRAHQHGIKIWTIRPGGSHPVRAFVDSSFAGADFGPSGAWWWSPDGTHIARVRPFAGYSEISIRDLLTGRERQVTHDHKQIGALCWTPQGEIVFSSDRGGSRNIWIIRASGGTPLQLTRGGGPDEL